MPPNAEGSRLAGEHVADAGEEALHGGAFVAGLGVAEFLEQLLLLLGHSRRSLDEHAGHEVSAAAAVEDAHARATMPKLLAGLDSGRDFELHRLAVDPGQADRSAE